MKARLMFRERDFVLKEGRPAHADALICDLGLDPIFDCMANGDPLLREIVDTALLTSLTEPDAIRYRQEILQDCLQHSDFARELYTLILDTLQRERSVWGWKSTRYPESTLQRSVDVLHIFVGQLTRLRDLIRAHAATLDSQGFRQLKAMLASELDDAFLSLLKDALRRLEFGHGIDLTARMGNPAEPIHYVLVKPGDKPGKWLERLQEWAFTLRTPKRECFVYEIHERDEAGYQALSELRGRAIAPIAEVAAQAADHISSFFQMLRLELGFYIGCLNLHGALAEKGEPTCFPTVHAAGKTFPYGNAIYDPGLSLRSAGGLIGNTFDASSSLLVLITGANRGGKSTFLRSIGIAQLMAQAGMFVGAAEFQAAVATGLFTHFRRNEDQGLRSGKFDEELRRMDAIVSSLHPGGILLLNESFASTNEREGMEIALQIVRALLQAGIRIAYVTHMAELDSALGPCDGARALVLHAELNPDGHRTFRVVAGKTNQASYGRDLYERFFGERASGTPEGSALASTTQPVQT